MSLRVTMAIYNMEIEINRKSFIEHYFLRYAFFIFLWFFFYYYYYYFLDSRYGLVVHYKLNKSHHVHIYIYIIYENKKITIRKNLAPA